MEYLAMDKYYHHNNVHYDKYSNDMNKDNLW